MRHTGAVTDTKEPGVLFKVARPPRIRVLGEGSRLRDCLQRRVGVKHVDSLECGPVKPVACLTVWDSGEMCAEMASAGFDDFCSGVARNASN